MFGISRETVERLKREYPVGTRVELVSMQDEYVKLAAGEKGTVIGVDDIGTICCHSERREESWKTYLKI